MTSCIRYYTVLPNICSCVNENEDLTPIGERYREYYNLINIFEFAIAHIF